MRTWILFDNVGSTPKLIARLIQMKRVRINSPDPDIRGTWPALQRAARKARQLAKSMGTPFYVMRRGKIVDLNASARRTTKRGS